MPREPRAVEFLEAELATVRVRLRRAMDRIMDPGAVDDYERWWQESQCIQRLLRKARRAGRGKA